MAQNMWPWPLPGLGGIHSRGRWGYSGCWVLLLPISPELSDGPYLQDSSSPQNLISSQLRSFLAVPMAMATSGQWWPEFPISENDTSIHPVLHVYRPMRHPSCPLSLTALNIEFMVVSYWFHLLILPTSLHLSLYLGSPQFRPPSSLAQRPATASSSALLRSTQDPSSPLPIYLPTLLKAQIWSYPPLLQTL